MGFTRYLLGVSMVMAFGFTSPNATEQAVLVTTDFSTGSLAAVDLGTNAVSANLLNIHSDAVVRTHKGKVYVINRLGQDNVIVLDGEHLSAPERQFSVGNGTNPQDIAFADDEKAYIARLQASSLLIVNPTTGDSLGTIDLSDFADADGMPEAAALEIYGDRLYVTCQRGDQENYFAPTDFSAIAVVDLATDQVVDMDNQQSGAQGIVLTAKNPAAQARKGSVLILSSVGSYSDFTDGGIEVVDLAQNRTQGLALTETDLGGNAGPMAMVDAEKGYVAISDANFANFLVPIDLGAKSVGAAVAGISGGYIPSIGVASGKLYVSDQGSFTDPTSGGLRVFDVSNNQLIAGPLNVGLPPADIAFLGVSSDSGTETNTRGPVALDLDLTFGDQALVQTASAPQVGDEVKVDVVAVSGANGQIGFQVVLKYDPAQVEWIGFEVKDLFAAAAALPGDPHNGEAQVNAAILGGTAQADAGTLGQATFKILSGFSGETTIELASAQFGTQILQVGNGGATVTLGGTSAFPTDPVARADFGGDGKVDFSDFLSFAGAFGKQTGDEGFHARADMNDDGKVDFTDFLAFAGVFGKTVGS